MKFGKSSEPIGQRPWFYWRHNSPYGGHFTYREMKLEQVEARILDSLKSTLERRFVHLPQSKEKLWTVIANKGTPLITPAIPNREVLENKRTPLVMVHGMGGGVGLWAQNIDVIARKRPVYTFDLLGFGRSSRPTFSSSPELVEKEFVDSIEEWRKEMKLDKMTLLGHSLGAYVVSSYALKYPDRIHHLYLVDPWGLLKMPKGQGLTRTLATFLSPFNPFAVFRLPGPLAPWLIKMFRPDLKGKYYQLFMDDTIVDYVYNCNAQKPSGEKAFRALSQNLLWAKNPMMERIENIDKKIPITFIYGSESWVDTECGTETKKLRPDSRVDVKVIEGAGHHVYADKTRQFNETLLSCLDRMDRGTDMTQEINKEIGEHSSSYKNEYLEMPNMGYEPVQDNVDKSTDKAVQDNVDKYTDKAVQDNVDKSTAKIKEKCITLRFVYIINIIFRIRKK